MEMTVFMEACSSPVWCKVRKGIRHVEAGFEELGRAERCRHLEARYRSLDPHGHVAVQGHETRIVTQAKYLTHILRSFLNVPLL
jgi:hypothetical protein